MISVRALCAALRALRSYHTPQAVCSAFLSALCLMPHAAQGQSPDAPTQQLWVTMHSAPIDDYCAPCIASEKLLKEENVEFKKVLEPLGPWPWFLLTDSKGNQERIRGGLSREDVLAIKSGNFPRR